MSAAPAARRTSPRARVREKQVEILRSAAAAFRRRGYHGASVGEIARALRMTKGNLYYYFKDRQELIFHCHMRCTETSLAALEEIAALGGSAEERLREGLARTPIASVGPAVSEELKSHGLRTDIYPANDAFFMKPLISAMAVALAKSPPRAMVR